MRKDTGSASYGGITTPGTATTTMSSSSHQKFQLQPNNTILYSPVLFTPEQSLPSSLSSTPYTDHSDSDLSSSSTAMHSHLYHTRLVQNHQEIVNRHSLCLSHLREASEEAEALRRENNHLRNFNEELNEHLTNLIHSSELQKQFDQSSSNFGRPPYDIGNAFRGLSVGERGSSSSWEEAVTDESPTSVIESGRIENVKMERFSLPKSISVRSDGYLKIAQGAAAHGGQEQPRNATRSRTAGSLKVAQKVYVPGGKKEEEPLELEVYNQGMYKTELCNKWQETGACSYGDHCQFAHGIKELRPIIRHPRYKTEVCRMVLSGVVCPYGHRCHFRHALTDQERLLAQQTTTSSTINMER